MPENDFAGPEPEEMETVRLVQAALEGPARPMRSGQIDMLVRSAAARHSIPGWILLILAAGPLAVIVLGILNGFHWNGPGALVLAVPLVNLALSPFAALLLYIRLTRQARLSETDKTI